MTQFDPKAYWEDRLSTEFSLQGVGRINFGKSFNKWAYRVRRSVFLDVLRSCGVHWSHQAVLDCGVGTGFYVERWKEIGVSKLTGIDLTAVAVRRLSERFPDDIFRQADIGSDLIDLEGQTYDAISCMDVLFHITDDERYRSALRNIHGLLQPGGLFVFTEVFPRQRTQRYSHVVLRSLAEITSLLDAAGFEIILRRPFLVLMGDPLDTRSVVLRSHYRLLGLMSRLDPVGFLLGGLLYPLELMLVSRLSESPSAEIMLCRRSPKTS